ncbi:mitochondrial import receptor subunit TOM20 homolog [Drosophila kikkawai]|uniref:Mitochondrial import receptor subunit TOM20 homolog n=1 Tax=Drosophila kikkawai TaxID=30033 RepID=A0A6P4IC46_DROKI|nr:mitochondrial import receptor subunit TOM20 homolog [Drosophila kikkawai]
MIKYLKLMAAVSGLMFLGYCVYFDKKRRSDPDFKRKLHERRNRRQATKAIPRDLNDKDMEMYFLDQMQRGQVLIMNGDIEGGVDHLINAIFVCNQPAKLLQVLQTTLPTEIFTMMLIKMHAYESGQKRPDFPPVVASEVSINAVE